MCSYVSHVHVDTVVLLLISYYYCECYFKIALSVLGTCTSFASFAFACLDFCLFVVCVLMLLFFDVLVFFYLCLSLFAYHL